MIKEKGYSEHPKDGEKFITKRLMGAVRDGRIHLDRKSLFNKIHDCPIQLPMPKTPEEMKYFLESIEWLFSKEGEEVSRHFGKFRKEYPKENKR